MHSGPSRSRRMARVSTPLIAVARVVPSAAPGTPQPRPQTVIVRPNTTISPVSYTQLGYMALNVAIASGAMAVLLPEKEFDMQRDILEMCIRDRYCYRSFYNIILLEEEFEEKI